MPLIALVPEIVMEIGAVAGLVAFLGVSLVTILLLVQSRDVRRLRDWAGRAPERDAEEREVAIAAVAERVESTRPTEPVTGDLPHGDPFEAEARATEIRAQRREVRSDTVAERLGGSRVAQAVLGVIAVLLVAGATYAAVGQFGGDDEPEGQRAAQQQRGQNDGQSPARGLDPAEIQVAVLNGTNASGLATAFQDGVSSAGYQVGAVGNSQSTYSDSRVMFNQGYRPEALAIAREFEISQVEPMVDEVRGVAEGAPLAVILGDDKIPTG